jgi:hypothetical protein
MSTTTLLMMILAAAAAAARVQSGQGFSMKTYRQASGSLRQEELNELKCPVLLDVLDKWSAARPITKVLSMFYVYSHCSLKLLTRYRNVAPAIYVYPVPSFFVLIVTTFSFRLHFNR